MAMTLRLTEEQDDMLTELAQREGVSKQEAVVRLIIDRAKSDRRESEIRATTREIVEEYGPLLDRLSQ